MNFEKYTQLFSLSWQNGLAYPISVLFWRFRQFLATFMALTVWVAVFTNQGQVFQYPGDQMVTYIFLIGVLQSLILATVMHSLAEDIYTGRISYQLIKPVNFFAYLATQEMADKIKNFLFILFEIGLLYWIFRPQLFIPPLNTLGLTLIAALMGAVILFLIMLLFGTVGFWSNETWGPRFLFYMFIEFTAGKFYPLDILPEAFQRVLFFTPFPYLSYVQTQLFLGKYTPQETTQMFVVLGVWIVGLTLLFRYLWRKGNYEYGAAGH